MMNESLMPNLLDFNRLFSEQRENVRLKLTRMVPAAEVDDLLQEVFVKTARALPEFRGEAGVATWLHRIAERTALDHLRSRRQYEAARTVPLVSSDELDGDIGVVAMPLPSVPAEAPRRLVRAEMGECVRGYVARLPEAHRAVIEMKDLEGLSNPEVARRLGVTLATAKIRLHLARQVLRRELERDCEFYRNEDNTLACDARIPPSTAILPVSLPRGISSNGVQLSSCAQRDSTEGHNENISMSTSSNCGCSAAPSSTLCAAPAADSLLTPVAAKFVAIGAAIGANCEPCLCYHVREALELGISAADIAQAVALAAHVKETPARNILKLAERLTQPGGEGADKAAPITSCGC